MFKRKIQFILALILIFSLISSICFATDDITSGEEVPATGLADEYELSAEDIAELYELYGADPSEMSEDELISAILASSGEEDPSGDTEADYNEEAIVSDDYYSSFSDGTMGNYTLAYEEKIIDGNTFLIGNEVVIDTDIYGDVFIIANKLTITERARACANIFAVANTITVDGLIYDLYAVCTNLYVSENGAIYRDLRVTAKNITMFGQVGRNMIVTSNDLILSQTDPETGEDISGIVYNNLEYNTVKNVIIPQSAVGKEVTPITSGSNTVIGYILTALSVILYAAGVYFVMTLIAPKFVEKVTGYMPKKLLLSLGLGVLAFICIIAISILLCSLSFAVGIAAILIGILLVLVLLSTGIISTSIGTFIAKKLKKDSKYISLCFVILTALIFWGISFIPYVGFVVCYILVPILGTGMVILSLINKKEKIKESVVE